MRKESGFTLMEILLVSVLIAAVSIAIFGVMNNGIKLWGRGMVVNKKGDLFIGLEKIAQDLRSALPFSLIAFKGAQTKVSFATIVLTPADGKSSRAHEGLIDELGAVEYRYDSAEGKLLRRQANYGQALKKQWGKDQEIASGISDVQFNYYINGSKAVERKSHIEAHVPTGVMMIVRLGENGQQELQRYFEIPAGGQ